MVVEVISLGNEKLGMIPNFSLAPVESCPGRTEFCSRYCYGGRGHFGFDHVKGTLSDNMELSLQEDFAELMIQEIRALRNGHVFRIHTVGDFYSLGYIQKWERIIRSFPRIRFYAYTRSWRVPELSGKLQTLAEKSGNFRIWASVDFTHKSRPDGWRQFSVMEHEGRPCPHDQGLVEHCLECGRCWQGRGSDTYVKLRWSKLGDNLSPRFI